MTRKNGKPCKKCGTSEWYSNGNCIECKRRNNKKWNIENSDKRRELNKVWFEENKDYHNKRMKKFYKENKKYLKAAGAVAYAVKTGRLPHVTTLRCKDCGKPAKEYHHLSYRRFRRLDVIPLCTACHGARHQTVFIDESNSTGVYSVQGMINPTP